MTEPTEYTAKLYLQAVDEIPGILAAAGALDFTTDGDAKCYDLIAGPIADALTRAGADCCLEDQLGLTLMMLAEMARRYTDLRSRLTEAAEEPTVSQAAASGPECVLCGRDLHRPDHHCQGCFVCLPNPCDQGCPDTAPYSPEVNR